MRSVAAACIVSALGLAAAAPAVSESIASSASSAASSAAGSASNSLESSSQSSGKTPAATAGEYRIEAVTAAADRPGMVRLALQPDAGGGVAQGFVLVLPQQVVEREGLTPGHRVSARQRAFGLEFARVNLDEAFYLVLDDTWHRELDARPVVVQRL